MVLDYIVFVVLCLKNMNLCAFSKWTLKSCGRGGTAIGGEVRFSVVLVVLTSV